MSISENTDPQQKILPRLERTPLLHRRPYSNIELTEVYTGNPLPQKHVEVTPGMVHPQSKVLLSFDSSWKTAATSTLACTECAAEHSRNIDALENRSGSRTADRKVQSIDLGKRCLVASKEKHISMPDPHTRLGRDRIQYGLGRERKNSAADSNNSGENYTEIHSDRKDYPLKFTLPASNKDQVTIRCNQTNNYKSSADICLRKVVRSNMQSSSCVYSNNIESSSPTAATEGNRLVRVAASLVVGLLFGLVLFVVAVYYIGCSLAVSGSFGGIIGGVIAILLIVSRICRSVIALLLPSACTGRGQIAYVIFIAGCLIGGPVTNVYRNVEV